MNHKPIPPCAGLTTRDLIWQVLKWQVVGLALLAVHVTLCKFNLLLFFPIVPLALGYLYYKAPLAGLLVFFQVLIYQNWFVSILSVGMGYETYTAIQGTSFAALVIMAGISFNRLISLRKWRYLNGRLIRAVKLALIAASIYAVYGMTKSGVTSAAVYFREATSLVLAVLIGLDVGRVWSFRTVGAGFVVSATLSILISLVEIAAPGPYYDTINAPNYYNLKYSKNVASTKHHTGDQAYYASGEQLAEANNAVFFNITGSDSTATSFRFMGTIMHPISYAYLLAGVGIVALSAGMWQWLLWIIPPMLAEVGVKGASLLLVCTLILWFIWYITRSSRFLLVSGMVFLVGYVGFGLYIGLHNDDYHVIGFMGGVKGLLSNPIGHGLGVGGNFSPQAEQGMNWSKMQRYGSSFAVESAVGVLIYQMGLAAGAIFAVMVLLLKESGLGARGPLRRDIVFLALATVAVNGVFQEEAYTSYACGLYTLFCAVAVANGQRATAICVPPRRQVMLRTPHPAMA